MRKYLKYLVLLILTAIFFWWFAHNLKWAEVSQSLSKSDWRLVAAAAAIISAGYLVRAFRWRTLLSPITPTRLRELFAATTMGFSSVFLFGRAGEVVRPVVLPLRDERVRPAASFVTIMVERLCDMVAVIMLFAINLLWFSPYRHAEEFAQVRKGGFLLLLGVGLALVFLAWFRRSSERTIRWLDGKLARWSFIPPRLRHLATHVLEQLAKALSIFTNLRTLAVTVAWTTALWLAVMVSTWLVMRAFGLVPRMKDAMFVMGWALVGSLVPTPGGGAGGFHAITKYGLTTFIGVEENQAAAIAIVLNLVYFAPALLFGLYYFLKSDVSIARLRQLTSTEAVEHAVEDEEIELSVAPDKELEPAAETR
ncbi:MAG TPA: lysylphosphatidylglycerol synthase transmembrane domain-containing protein [Pyrinomonadaceae bacterium]